MGLLGPRSNLEDERKSPKASHSKFESDYH
jgi:hypothetical protein